MDRRRRTLWVGAVDGPLTIESKTDDAARALAREVLEPLTTGITRTEVDLAHLEVELGCEQGSRSWSSQTDPVQPYSRCLDYPLESWLACYRDLERGRELMPDDRRAAIAEVIEREGTTRGLKLAPLRRPE